MAKNSDGTVVKQTGSVRKGTSTTINRPGVAQGLGGSGTSKVDNSTKLVPSPRKQR